MAADSEIVLHYIRRLVGRPGQDGASDAALLGRFISARDEEAFAALVDRHGPLVLQVCRRVLGDVDDAEDAFQAAFMVLARKADTVHPREALAAWLHGVAHRVALKSRSARVRQCREAQPLTEHAANPQLDPLAQLSARELLSIVDEEVRRLPQVYRLPVILCCLEGRSQEEAARQLGWTPGSVKGRLERGRARLHDRLVRRGLTLSAALTAAEALRDAASAATVARLAVATGRNAILFAARSAVASEISPGAAALAGKTLTSMALAKLRVTLLLATFLLATGFLTSKVANFWFTTAPPGHSSPFFSEYAALPARSIRGMVRDKATGKPVPGVRISTPGNPAIALTDQDGIYELLGCSKSQDCIVSAQPPTDQPYFAAEGFVPDRPGQDHLIHNFDLVRGIPMRGRVTDQSTHRPPKAAVVEYFPLFLNAHSAKIAAGTSAEFAAGTAAASSAVTQPDGSYGLVVLPGPGIIGVTASPRNSYAVAVLDRNELVSLFNDAPRGNLFANASHFSPSQNPRTVVGLFCVNQYHALSLIKPTEKSESVALDLLVEPARLLRGAVAGPDGEPLTGVRVVGLTPMPEEELLEGASFTITGLNPRRSRDLYFHHKTMGLGKFLILKGNDTKPLQVQLEPCGTVTGRIVDKAGEPVPGVHVGFFRRGDYYTLHITGVETDIHGRFRIEGLVPGPKYSFTQAGTRRLLRDVGDVEVESGRTKDLGDLPLGD